MIQFYFLYVSVLIFCFNYSFCQQTGKIEVISDSRINVLIEKHVAFNENKGSIKGFRVQIFFDSGNNSKSKAVTALNEFKIKYPETEAYLMFQEPNYKVRVGDYRSRMDAQRFLHKIINEYPNAFVVKDSEINYPNLEDK